MKNNTLLVNNIFASIDGEVNRFGQGTPSIFVRLAGCNLRCPFCDTKWAQDSSTGVPMTVERVIKDINAMDPSKACKITITGGEPLLQFDPLFALLKRLLWCHHKRIRPCTIETNGTRNPEELISAFDNSPFGVVMDYKIPRLMEESFAPSFTANYFDLKEHDWIKAVVESPEDIDHVMGWWQNEALIGFDAIGNDRPPSLAISPLWGGQFSPGELADYVVKKRYPITVNLQLHKILWPNAGQGDQEK